MSSVPARHFIDRLIETSLLSTKLVAIDVRSEAEFKDGSISGTINYPILKNTERHQVGLAYKKLGQDEAIRLGHEIVKPNREERIREWVNAFKQAEEKSRFVFCWRGGLRSKLACEWLEAASCSTSQIEGGYKGVRKILTARFEGLSRDGSDFLVISGPTGSGKTELLRDPSFPFFDLEKHANHRGSTFGLSLEECQPTQATFENRLGLDLLSLDRRWENSGARQPYFVEDESPGIGTCWVPKAIQASCANAPVIIVEESLENRARSIEDEYVAGPLRRGTPIAVLHQHLAAQLIKLQKRLGHQRCKQLLDQLQSAFLSTYSPGSHLAWISPLLLEYYDPGYTYALQRSQRKILFKGNRLDCHAWLKEKI